MKPRVLMAVTILSIIAATLPSWADPALAAGTPDVTLATTMPAETLYGAPTAVTLTASNTTGTNGYNLSFNDVLPPGATYVPGSGTPAPTRTFIDALGNQVLIWENVADLQAGTSVQVAYQFLADDPDYIVGNTITNSAGAYVNTDARLVPDFDPLTGAATGDFTGSDTATATTRLVPFTLRKSEPSQEQELLRGVHDHKSVYTLTVTNNLENPTTGFQIEDYLPAGLEFLGCGGIDNTAIGVTEYPGSGRIDATADPALTNCVTPSTVETVQDPPGLPAGIYTHVVWTAADLNAATAGQADLAASGTLTIDYVAAIPLRRNVLFPGGTATSGVQTANLDNNTGTPTADEQGLTNAATATGTYGGPYSGSGPSFTDGDTGSVTAEDVSIHKTVDVDTIEQTDVSTWTLLVETSEYATSTTGIVVTDTIPDGLCPVAPGTPCDGAAAAPSPAAASVVENANGTWTIVWNLANLPAPNSSSTVTFRTVAEDSYTTGGGPVASNDAWTNSVSLTSTSAVITANDGSTTSLTIDDASSAGQSAGGISILKEVSVPQAGTLTCGDGSGITAWNATASGDYRPGDRVCWRLTIDFPGLLDTLNINVTDLLPAGFAFESTTFGANHDATGFGFNGATPVPSWSAAGIDIGGEKFEAIVSSLISDPEAAGDGDILANLMKVTYTNTAGSVFQLRDQADATWAEPELTLDKGVMAIDALPVPGAPADGVQVQAGDVVAYQVAVTNDGSIDALATSVRDVLPDGITCSEVGSIDAPGACSAPDGWIQWDGLTVVAGTTLNLSYDVTIPNGVAAGASFDNLAGIRRYESPTNRPAPDDTQEYVPGSNIDPTLEIDANTAPASDPSDVYVAAATVTKSRTTAIVEAGNNANQATIGETVTYTITAVIPQGATLYGPFTLTDAISSRLTHVAGTATATLNGVALPTAGMTLSDTGANLAVTMAPSAPYTNAADTGDDTLAITFTAVVDDEPTNRRVAGSIPNTAVLRWEDAAGNATTATASANTAIVEPNLNITKTDDDLDGILDPGQDVVFTITATNTTGTRVSTAHDLVVVDLVPAELTPLEGPNDPAEDGDTIPSSGGTWNETARTITWNISSLAPGASTARTYTARANDPLLGSSTITNTATVTGSSLAGTVPGERDATSSNGGSGSGYQATADNTLTAPALGIAKTVTPATATVGEIVEYTLDVTIPAGVIVYDATVVDDLPDGILYDSTTASSCDQGGGACSPAISVAPIGTDGDAVAWFLGDLGTAAAADRVVTIVYEAYLDEDAAVVGGATLSNTAVVVGNQTNQPGIPATPPDPTTYDIASPPATIDVDVVEPTLTIDKDVAGQAGDTDTRRAVPGDTLTFSVIVENTGSSPAWDIDVTDTPDPDLLLVDVPAGAGYSVVDGNPADGTLAWTIAGPLAPGATFTLTYQLQVPAGFDETDEVPGGPEFINTADAPHYFGVDPTLHDPGRTYRDYDDVTADIVSIEADLASIGDRVWFDINGDGIQDPGEPGLAGVDVTVTYLGLDNAPGGGDDEAYTVTTGALGGYLVEDLPGGQYLVVVDAADIPEGMEPSFDLDGSTVTPNGSWTGTLAENDAKRDVDFGYTGNGSIGDTIWFDRNGNGTVDAEEPGLEGVDVVVTWLGFDDSPGGGDDVTYTATTIGDGTYLVPGLPAGEYTVAVDTADLPPGFAQVYDPDATIDDATGVSLSDAEDHLTADFGYRGSGSIGDFVWLDPNGDGIQDPDEPGIEGVAVELTWYGPDGVAGGGDDALFTTTTGTDGAYLFDYLPPGLYVVDVTGGLPAAVANSFDEDGNNNSSTPVILADGENHLTADFGYFGSTSIGDRVWWDVDADGVQDGTEPGLGGAEVTVTYAGADDTFGSADDEVFLTSTDANGDYLVTGVPAGDYRVAVTGGIGTGLTITYDEDDGTTGPDGTTSIPGLGAAAHLTADFGYVGTGSLGDTVWLDLDGDGTQDADEPGLASVTVDLLWFGPDGVAGGGDDASLQTVTAADGTYSFVGLPAGDFSVTVDGTTIAPGLNASFDLDPTADGATVVTLADGEDRADVDFGYRGSGSVGDTVWLDLNGDGVIDPGEPGIPGVDVTVTWAGSDGVLGSGDDYDFTTTTDAGGGYLVSNLPDGDIRVVLSGLPGGVGPTLDPDDGLPDTSLLTLSPGEANLEQDFGYRGTSGVGDTVWLDLDDNGIQDPGEPGVPGIGVTVTSAGSDGVLGSSDDLVISTVTDADGNYLIPGLPSDATQVSLDPGELPPGFSVSSDLDGGDPTTTTITLADDETRLDVDYPLLGDASLSGVVWDDSDGDGIRDPGETGIGEVTVIIVWEGPDGPIALEVTTAPDGSWSLVNIPPGDYSAEIQVDTVPDGFAPTTPTTVDVTVPPGGSAFVEHGVAPVSAIGSTVWIDSDQDGELDPGEPGIPDVRVLLIDAAGTVIAQQVTDANGEYLFEGLLPGTYTVRIDRDSIPNGLAPVSDPDGLLDLETEVSVSGGLSVLTANFGFLDRALLPSTGFALGLGALGALLLLLGSSLLGAGRYRRYGPN